MKFFPEAKFLVSDILEETLPGVLFSRGRKRDREEEKYVKEHVAIGASFCCVSRPNSLDKSRKGRE